MRRVSLTEFASLSPEEQRAEDLVVSAECGLVLKASSKLKEDESEFIITTGSDDRMGDDIVPEGGDLKAWKKNPVVLYGHDYRSLPVGKGRKVWVDEDGQTHAIVKWVPGEIYAFAETVMKMVKEGFLSAASIGFRPLKYELKEDKDGRWLGYKFEKWEMLEFSIVPVPANSEALVVARSAQEPTSAVSLRSWLASPIEEGQQEQAPDEVDEFLKGLDNEVVASVTTAAVSDGEITWIPSPTSPLASHQTATSIEPWDAGTQVKGLPDEGEPALYQRMFAWTSPSEDPSLKGAWKLAHHFVKDGVPGAASTIACRQIIENINGARGGTKLANDVKRAVYEHLAQHLRDAGEEVPDLKGVDTPAPGTDTQDVDARTLQLLMDAVRAAATEAVNEAVKGQILPAIERALAGKVAEKICDEFDLLDPDEVKHIVRGAIRKETEKRTLAVLGRLPEEV